jgi:carbonic anhydrase
MNVCKNDIVSDAWNRNQTLSVHGWIYDIKDGLLQDLDVCISKPDEVETSVTNAINKISS